MRLKPEGKYGNADPPIGEASFIMMIMIEYRKHILNPGKNFILAGLFLCFSSMAFGQQPVELYKTASQLYKAGQFDQAAADYEKIIGQGYKTAEVYYNLGNCYYKLNTLNKAIVNYERALKLAPQDEDIQHNLAVANTKVVDKIIPVPTLAILNAWDGFVSIKSSNGWALLAVGFIWLSLLFFAIYLFVGIRRVSFALGSLFLIASLVFIGLAVKQSSKEQQADTAILMVSNSFVKSAPDANGNDQFMLHEGVKFQILDRVGEWSKIRLADGKVGWIERSSYEKI
jgi:tetratricopeptide (TPR) repeat protein